MSQKIMFEYLIHFEIRPDLPFIYITVFTGQVHCAVQQADLRIYLNLAL